MSPLHAEKRQQTEIAAPALLQQKGHKRRAATKCMGAV